MPFRRASALIPGIDLPDLTMADLRQQLHDASARLVAGPKIMLFGCAHGVDPTRVASKSIAALRLPCIGHLPPAFIDYALSRNLADGVFLTGCAEGACQHRFGIAWTEARLAGERDPHLRKRVPLDRVCRHWIGPGGERDLAAALGAFADSLKARSLPASLRIDPPSAAEPERRHG
jgi:coenzyme F420-reducing hydrogenase delta subunit